jgi:endonuclease/exonuclease/phosphatase family metal-dependent hydrolase
MFSGGAILSRFPIEKNTVQLLSKPTEYPFYYNLFYLFRYLQHAVVRIGSERVHLFNTHLEAFKEKNRIEQAHVVEKVLAGLDDKAVIFGGDFNAVPSEATKKSDYPDETTVKTTHEQDDTVKIVRGIKSLTDAFPAEIYSASEEMFFTFPAHEPNRKLDHFFFGERFELIDARVAREVGETSDHLPLVIRLRFKPGRET